MPTYSLQNIAAPRSRRGVTYLSSRERSPLPETTLEVMQQAGQDLLRNVTALENNAVANIQAFQFISNHNDVPLSQRQAASLLWHALRGTRDVLRGLQDTLNQWRTDLRAHVSNRAREQLANPVPIDAYLELNRQGLMEFRMELADLQTAAAVQRTRLALDDADSLRGQLGAYLQHAPVVPQQGPGHGHDDDGPAADGAGIGIQAAADGRPEGISSYQAGYAASWETQARFFQHGCRVNFDANRRRYFFPDNSRVEIQSHTPVLTYSVAGELLLATAIVAGVVGTLATAGAAGAILVGGTAVVGGTLVRPFDATWQGYTAQFFSPGEDAVWGTQHFFGRKTTQGGFSTVTVNGARNATQFVNFADQINAYEWESWWRGWAPPRRPQWAPADGPHDRRCDALPERLTISQQMQSVLQNMVSMQNGTGGFAPQNTGGSDGSRLLSLLPGTEAGSRELTS